MPDPPPVINMVLPLVFMDVRSADWMVGHARFGRSEAARPFDTVAA